MYSSFAPFIPSAKNGGASPTDSFDSKDSFRSAFMEIHHGSGASSGFQLDEFVKMRPYDGGCDSPSSSFAPNYLYDGYGTSTIKAGVDGLQPNNNNNNINKPHQCPHCTFSTNYAKNLVRHVDTLHNPTRNGQGLMSPQQQMQPPQEYPCDICGQEFATSKQLLEHEAQQHSQTELYRCPECPRIFKTKMTLKYHADFHNPRKPYICDIDGCERAFRTPKYLKNHRDEFHKLQPKEYCCPVQNCPEIFHRKTHLKRHIASHSNGVASTNAGGHLQPHQSQQQQQHQQKRYGCPWPGGGIGGATGAAAAEGCTFHAPSLLEVSEHYRASHPFDRFYHCLFCAFTHRDQDALRDHYHSQHPRDFISRSMEQLFGRYEAASMPEPIELPVSSRELWRPFNEQHSSLDDEDDEEEEEDEEEENETISNPQSLPPVNPVAARTVMPDGLLPNVLALLERTNDPSASQHECDLLHQKALTMLPPFSTGERLAKQIDEVVHDVFSVLSNAPSDSESYAYLEQSLKRAQQTMRDEDMHVIELVEHQLASGVELTVPYPPRKRGRRPKIQQQLRFYLEKLYLVDALVADMISCQLIQMQCANNQTPVHHPHQMQNHNAHSRQMTSKRARPMMMDELDGYFRPGLSYEAHQQQVRRAQMVPPMVMTGGARSQQQGGPGSVSSTSSCSQQMITSPKSAASQLPPMTALTAFQYEMGQATGASIMPGTGLPCYAESTSSGYCSSSHDSHHSTCANNSLPPQQQQQQQLHSPGRPGPNSLSSDSPPRVLPRVNPSPPPQQQPPPPPQSASSGNKLMQFNNVNSSGEAPPVDHLQYLSELGAKYTAQPKSTTATATTTTTTSSSSTTRPASGGFLDGLYSGLRGSADASDVDSPNNNNNNNRSSSRNGEDLSMPRSGESPMLARKSSCSGEDYKNLDAARYDMRAEFADSYGNGLDGFTPGYFNHAGAGGYLAGPRPQLQHLQLPGSQLHQPQQHNHQQQQQQHVPHPLYDEFNQSLMSAYTSYYSSQQQHPHPQHQQPQMYSNSASCASYPAPPAVANNLNYDFPSIDSGHHHLQQHQAYTSFHSNKQQLLEQSNHPAPHLYGMSNRYRY